MLECPVMGQLKQLVRCLLFMVWLVHSGGSSGGGGFLLFVLYLLLALLLQLFFSVFNSVGWSLILFTLCFPGLVVLYVYSGVIYFLISVLLSLSYLFNFSFHPEKGY